MSLVAAAEEAANALTEGIIAYASQNARLCEGLASKFEALWGLPDKEHAHRTLDLCCRTKRSDALWAQITHKKVTDLSDSDVA